MDLCTLYTCKLRWIRLGIGCPNFCVYVLYFFVTSKLFKFYRVLVFDYKTGLTAARIPLWSRRSWLVWRSIMADLDWAYVTDDMNSFWRTSRDSLATNHPIPYLNISTITNIDGDQKQNRLSKIFPVWTHLNDRKHVDIPVLQTHLLLDTVYHDRCIFLRKPAKECWNSHLQDSN